MGGWRDVVKIESFSRPKRGEGQLGRSLTYEALDHIRLAPEATTTSHSRLSFNNISLSIELHISCCLLPILPRKAIFHTFIPHKLYNVQD